MICLRKMWGGGEPLIIPLVVFKVVLFILHDRVLFHPDRTTHNEGTRCGRSAATWARERRYELRAPSVLSRFPSISSVTPAGNLVGKLFCVCLPTVQSQVRWIHNGDVAPWRLFFSPLDVPCPLQKKLYIYV